MLQLSLEEITPSVSGFCHPAVWANKLYRLTVVRGHGDEYNVYIQPGAFSCCGFCGIQHLYILKFLTLPELKEVYQLLKTKFGPKTRRDGRVSPYQHKQMFFTDQAGLWEERKDFWKVFNVKQEFTWQSASEPGHLTAMYSINF